MNILWEWIWPAWLILCWILQVSKKDPLRGLSAHAYVGMATYFPLRLCTAYYNMSTITPHQFVVDHYLTITLSIGILTQAASLVWFVSPGAIPFLLAPYRVLLAATGRPMSEQPPVWTDDKRIWTRSSWKYAIFIIAIWAIMFVVFRKLFI